MTTREFTTPRGLRVRLPLTLPVYQPRSPLVPSSRWKAEFPVEGCISNAFFLYKDRPTRVRFESGEVTLAQHLGFDGFLMTDSGAF